MAADRYLKIVLTIIALELFWIGVKDMAPAVSAQADATRVVIAGIDLPRNNAPTLPVTVTNEVAITSRAPLRITADRPLKIEADRPLRVENVPYTPGRTPGE